ncbi:MAG: LysR family transcriptional regulator [Steroidobacteraceae bacterium]|nr:LysR family transcriptional regulator [Steroidobacteraceae bacterium]
MAEPTCMNLLDWEDLRFFTVLARYRRIEVTARTLGVPRGEVMRRVVHLERALETRLFVRSAVGWRLNATGAAVLHEVAQMEMAACAIFQQVARTNAGAKVPRRR